MAQNRKLHTSFSGIETRGQIFWRKFHVILFVFSFLIINLTSKTHTPFHFLQSNLKAIFKMLIPEDQPQMLRPRFLLCDQFAGFSFRPLLAKYFPSTVLSTKLFRNQTQPRDSWHLSGIRTLEGATSPLSVCITSQKKLTNRFERFHWLWNAIFRFKRRVGALCCCTRWTSSPTHVTQTKLDSDMQGILYKVCISIYLKTTLPCIIIIIIIVTQHWAPTVTKDVCVCVSECACARACGKDV